MVWDAVLVPVLAQNRFSMMTGLFVASSPAFLWKAAEPAQRSCGLDPSNRPQTIELGLWGRHSLHQSRPRQIKAKTPNQMHSKPTHP